MTPVLRGVIVLDWLLIIVGALTFAALYWPPWRSSDRTMAWHLFLVTFVAGVEPIGFILAGISLLPAAIIETGSTALVLWRLGLLIRARRRAKQRLGKTRV